MASKIVLITPLIMSKKGSSPVTIVQGENLIVPTQVLLL